MIFFNLGVIPIAIGLIGGFISLKWGEWWDEAITMICCGFCILGVVIVICDEVNRTINPTAIDVYRGKTTLEITYRGRTPIDTVVVFKERK